MASELALVYEMAVAGAPETPGGPPSQGPSLWDRYGVPRPAGSWTTIAGQGTPGFLYIIRWESMAERDAHFPRFWTDPYWRARRAQLTDGMTLVDEIETWLMQPLPEVSSLLQSDAEPLGGVHEMLVLQVAAGERAVVATALANEFLPAIRKAGAVIVGAFAVAVGPDLPKMVVMLAWPEPEQAMAADARAAVAALSSADMVQDAKTWLLDPQAWNLPQSGLGEPQ